MFPANFDKLRKFCKPDRQTELDERLKGVYGRMHIQAFKLAALLTALDWLNSDTYTPTITQDHWQSAKAIAEIWRDSAAQLLQQMDCRSRTTGCSLREVYHNLKLSAKRARQLAQDLVKAGLIVEHLHGRAEWYVVTEFAD